MDEKFTKRYGNVRIVREKDLPIEDETDSIVDEASQIIDDLKREAIDLDERLEDETIEPEKDKEG